MKLTLLSVVGMASLAFATPTVKRGQPATYGGSGMGGGNNGGGMGGGEGGNNNGGGNGGSGGQSGGPVCAGSATPLCCATDVLGVAALTCSDREFCRRHLIFEKLKY